jgi:hypothetical protein
MHWLINPRISSPASARGMGRAWVDVVAGTAAGRVVVMALVVATL